MTSTLLTTDLGGLPWSRGARFATFMRWATNLLFVATDRISAFDHVLGSGIPDKGRILTQISSFWFEFLKDTVANHLLATEPEEMADLLEPFSEQIFGKALLLGWIWFQKPAFPGQIAGRSMIVRRAQMFPVECVVRGYLSGSGWKDYRATGAVCGIRLPEGLRESEQLPEPIFTPAAKVNTGGHDENISYRSDGAMVGAETAAALRRLTLDLREGFGVCGSEGVDSGGHEVRVWLDRWSGNCAGG
jgi:phosphoribosylaminoimidazole-succinocarboxamide synthase